MKIFFQITLLFVAGMISRGAEARLSKLPIGEDEVMEHSLQTADTAVYNMWYEVAHWEWEGFGRSSYTFQTEYEQTVSFRSALDSSLQALWESEWQGGRVVFGWALWYELAIVCGSDDSSGELIRGDEGWIVPAGLYEFHPLEIWSHVVFRQRDVSRIRIFHGAGVEDSRSPPDINADQILITRHEGSIEIPSRFFLNGEPGKMEIEYLDGEIREFDLQTGELVSVGQIPSGATLKIAPARTNLQSSSSAVMVLTIDMAVGRPITIEYSEDLREWKFLKSFDFGTDTQIMYWDKEAASSSRRFYRVRIDE